MRALRCLEKSGNKWDLPSYAANILEERIPQLHCCGSITRQATYVWRNFETRSCNCCYSGKSNRCYIL